MSSNSDDKPEFPDVPDFEFVRLIGKGAYGQVFAAYDNFAASHDDPKARRRLVAVKVVDVTDKQRAYLANEVDVLSSLDHPCIVKYLRVSP